MHNAGNKRGGESETTIHRHRFYTRRPMPCPMDDTLGDNLLYFNIDSVNPTPAAWATTAESPATLDAPTVALAPPPGSLPEPGVLLLLTAGLASLLMSARRRL